MNTTSHRLMLGACALGLLALGVAIGYHRQRPASAPAAAPASARTILYWYDPMLPDERYPGPGLSSMGMPTQPKYADEVERAGVRVDPRVQQNLGLRTAVVERRALVQPIEVPARIDWDLREERVVSARVDAIVTRLYVRAPYETIRTGQPLAQIAAPQWGSALAERAALAHARSPEARALRGAADARLRALGLDAVDARAAAGGAITLHAPAAGIVTGLEVREGQRVAAGQTLLTINGGRELWVEAAVPQAQATLLQAGVPARVRVDAAPGRDFSGRVEAVLPDIDPASRTQRVRIVLAAGPGLSPGQFAHVRFAVSDGPPQPLVPDDALIATGAQTRVLVADGDGRFHPVAVTTGRSAGGLTEVLAGLHGGERVVVSGQFLLDSEASLQGALSRMPAASPAPSPAQDEAVPPVPQPPPAASPPVGHAHHHPAQATP